MKKCPFCKAEIEENARFCLYCMTSLEDKQEIAIPKRKNKRWLVVLAAVLVFVLVVFSICLALRKDSPKDISNGASSESQTLLENDSNTSTNDTNTIVDNSAQGNDLIAGSQSALSGESGTNQNSPQSNPPANNENANNNPSANPTTGPANSGNPSTESTGSNIPTTGNGGSNTTTSSGEQEKGENSPSDSIPEPSVSTATYVYRYAKYGDDFSVSTDLDDCVVITGVSTASSNGEYIIPETLGGKKVIAIMGLAFCDDNIKHTVKKVVVPASVKTIWGNAFANCYNLTDIYFRGQSIYVEGNAFAAKTNRTGTLTIHCSYNCSDRNLRYYRNSASNYNALYEEWDG